MQYDYPKNINFVNRIGPKNVYFIHNKSDLKMLLVQANNLPKDVPSCSTTSSEIFDGKKFIILYGLGIEMFSCFHFLRKSGIEPNQIVCILSNWKMSSENDQIVSVFIKDGSI